MSADRDKWAEDFDEMFSKARKRAWSVTLGAAVLSGLLTLAVIALIIVGIIWLASK
jgi:hypothetical protein